MLGEKDNMKLEKESGDRGLRQRIVFRQQTLKPARLRRSQQKTLPSNPLLWPGRH